MVETIEGSGGYALYNGNIEVPENAHAVRYLIREVFNDIDFPLKVAGMNPPERIKKLAEKRENIELIANPDDEKMFELIRNAHVNILVTFQATGLKLKLLNTLYKGRFCLVNDKMLNGTGLNELCVIGNSPLEQKEKLRQLFAEKFTNDKITLRREILEKNYSNEKNAQKLIESVFGQE
jgi:glycosyltransferase involved in cell wall biosynthesis